MLGPTRINNKRLGNLDTFFARAAMSAFRTEADVFG